MSPADAAFSVVMTSFMASAFLFAPLLQLDPSPPAIGILDDFSLNPSLGAPPRERCQHNSPTRCDPLVAPAIDGGVHLWDPHQRVPWAHLWDPHQRVPRVGSRGLGLLRPISTVGVADPTAERTQVMWHDAVCRRRPPRPMQPDATASALMGDALRHDMSRHGHARFAARELASTDATISAPTRNDGPEYLMNLSIGTPPVAFPAIIDTGSNVIMAQCAPCGGFDTAPLYNPSSSSTFSDRPVRQLAQGGFLPTPRMVVRPTTRPGTYAEGWAFFTMAMETFAFGSTSGDDQEVPVAGMAFGCVNDSSGGWGSASGMVGLGRGNLSLVKQLGASRFSYCLTAFHDGNSTSTLRMGHRRRSTTRAPSRRRSTHYYLNLTGISVGDKSMSIPADAFSLSADGSSGGLIIDSGLTTTTLVDVAYQQVRAEIVSLVTLPPIDEPQACLELCFNASQESTSTMTDMTFHFDGEDMVLPAESYMYLSSGSEWCLRMNNASAEDGSVLGNYQQQNIHFLFDLDNEMLSFAPADCSTI
ncbi:hypothetical protein HU200_009897 [Digitaria exilis]|uniref:Peptidase A1 domain-containing protein n=1 Tax=Digitaria exilis TaxID=1010633 RepID=A0A835FJ28_9POAL|nr:hypothetical protein HU200_009897 [Digitaria exilis]